MNAEHPIISPKKLIEVALPLDAINKASAREKSIRHGHPSTLHLWWARRPLAAARAVIFSQLVHDPEDLWYHQNPGKQPNKQVRGHWTKGRERLFNIIEDLVLWENTTNEAILDMARKEIRKSWRETCELNKSHPQASDLFDPSNMPGLHDPFAGGGTIPLEAQRLGIEAYASDLNPVAVLINKAMIEIPSKFADMPPVNPDAHNDDRLLDRQWLGAEGLAEDVRYYGEWMRDKAEHRIGHLFPEAKVTDEIVAARPDLEPYQGKKLRVIAWLWARTVKSPNPAFSDIDVPLVSTFMLGTKPGKEAFVKPEISDTSYRFGIEVGTPTEEAKRGTSAGRRKAFTCLMSSTPIAYDYIRSEAKAGRLGVRLMAIVAEGVSGRVYLPPTAEHELVAASAEPKWRPDSMMPLKHRNFQPPVYGMNNVGDLFTDRQLVSLDTFCGLLKDVKKQIEQDESDRCKNGEKVSSQRADAIVVYLAFALSRMVNYSSTLCVWSSHKKDELVKQVFMRQALPMTWDFAESNPFSKAGGTLDTNVKYLIKAIRRFPAKPAAHVEQSDAQSVNLSGRIVATDPPYYDNVSYADLSDFFYVWIRRALRDIYPEILSTIGVPKADELIASPTRHGGNQAAEEFFLSGMTEVMSGIAQQSHPAYPTTIFYSFKQSETKEGTTTNTGWDSFLEAIHAAGFALGGTWPMRTELTGNLKKKMNALASSVVLVCRRRPSDATSVSRREFIRELNATLPSAIDAMTRETEDLPSPVAPVDLSQAVIGPGMAVFSKYSSVLEADGSPMTVRTALQLINRFLAEDDFDADTQFCLHWFDQQGWEPGIFGEADVLARAKATSVSGLEEAGVLQSGGGKVQLLKWNELPSDWNPQKDMRIPIWEVLHQLIRALRQGGESAAGSLLGYGNVQSRSEAARQLAYRLYTLCERKNWSEDARAYNELITSWNNIESATPQVSQRELF